MKIISSTSLIAKPTQAFNTNPIHRQDRDNFASPNYSKSSVQNSPAYFHPSFCATNSKNSKSPKRQLGDFIDFAIANINNPTALYEKSEQTDFDGLIKSCAIHKNFLGSGAHADVYRLNSKYVLKVHGNENDNAGYGVQVLKNPLFDGLKLWCGGALVKIDNVWVLKNANPDGKAIPVGIPYHLNVNVESINTYNEIYLPKCAALPQKAFDALAADFKTLNKVKDPNYSDKRSYSFDYMNPNNFLITNDSIKIVDEVEPKEGHDFNNLGSMVNVFLNKYTLIDRVKPDPTLFEPRREILKKCLLATERSRLLLPPDDVGKVERSFELAGMENKWYFVNRKINELRVTVQNTDERVNLLGEYFDKL